jgi:hypothetical protein
MINSTLGAPFGGLTNIGQYGVDCAALGLITPSKVCGGEGRYLPSMVVVAPGDPGVPVTCGSGEDSAVDCCASTSPTLNHMKAARLAKANPAGKTYLKLRVMTSLPTYGET